MDVVNADAPVTIDVLLAQDKYQELLESHHLMTFLNDPKAKVELTRSLPGLPYHICEFTDPFDGISGIEFGDTPREALSAALRVIKKRRAYRESKEAA